MTASVIGITTATRRLARSDSTPTRPQAGTVDTPVGILFRRLE